MRAERMTVTSAGRGDDDHRPLVDPTLAVITVNYRSEAALNELIDSLAAATILPLQTIVVNNEAGASLRLPALEGLTIVDAGENLGYGGGINAGARGLAASVEWILVTNPDVRIEPDALDTLLAAARAQPTAGSVGPRILEPTGEVYPSARELPSLRTGIGHALLANVWLRNPWTRRYRGENRETTGTWRETGWLSGSCVLVRRAAFAAIDGFDDSYFMYFEDVDLGARLTKAGWRNLYVPGATVTHTGAHSTSTAADSMRAEHHRSAYQYLSRKYAGWYLAPLRAVLKAALMLRARFTSRG